MHVCIQQVRVFCRVKPHPTPSLTIGSEGLTVRTFGPDQKDQSFSFDRVFGPNASQADVFAEVAELVQSALDGYKVSHPAYFQWIFQIRGDRYFRSASAVLIAAGFLSVEQQNVIDDPFFVYLWFHLESSILTAILRSYEQVCIFSYGQTGAGKTHTMQGSRSGPNQGIIPRAILLVRRTGQKPVIKCSVSFLSKHVRPLQRQMGASSSLNLEAILFTAQCPNFIR
jgi:Microtubule binding/Kinesin motor domain